MEEYFEANRAARFRGVFCDTPRKEAIYAGLLVNNGKPNRNIPVVKASVKLIATSGRGADGAFSVIPISRPGTMPSDEPTIRGHTMPITDLAFSPFEENIIASASMDKTIAFWKVPKKGLTSEMTDPQLVLEGHEAAVNLIRFHPTSNGLLASAASDSTLRLWDLENGAPIYETVAEDVTDLVWNVVASEYLIASSSHDVKLCDARNKKPAVNAFTNTAGGFVNYLGMTHMIMTVNVSSSVVKLWDYRNSCTEIAAVELKHPISSEFAPLYDTDLKLLYVTDSSAKNVSIYDVSAKDPYLKHLYQFKGKSSARAMTMVPKRAINIAGCEIARLLKLTNEKIEPLSFAVPRILDNFQEDLYPDTFCGVESQSKAEWIEKDISKPPVLDSLHRQYFETENLNMSMLAKGQATAEAPPVAADPAPEDDEEDELDMVPIKLIQGTAFLKFGKRGIAHEKMLRLQEGRYLTWEGAWFSPKMGRKCYVDLEKALRIQRGQMTVKFDRESKHYGAAKDTAFSVIYIEKREEKSIDFIAQSKEDFDLWFNTIEKILKKIKEVRETTALISRFLKFYFELADVDKNELLTNSEVNALITQLSINSSSKDVHSVFQQVNAVNTLTFEQFSKFVFTLRRRFDLELLWNKLIEDRMVDEVLPLQVTKEGTIDAPFNNATETLSLENFTRFWRNSTQTSMSDADAEKLIAAEAEQILRTFMGREYNDYDPQLSYEGFFKLMNSETNDAYSPATKLLHEDMTHPLSYYFMYSSHNTYLESDQVIGKSSVNRYINDLTRGVRCIELDTWDGPDGDPIIKHGGTLTSSILFIDVIKAIKTFGFVTSPYPVVLSIENHCSFQQQRRMAIIMRGVFGDMLVDANEGYYARSDTLLESPDDFREKILVKGSRPRTGILVEDDDEDDDEDLDYDDDDEDEDDEGASVSEPGSSGQGTGSISQRRSTDYSSSADENSMEMDDTFETGSVRSSTSGGSSVKKRKGKRGGLKKENSTLSSYSTVSKDSSMSSVSKTASVTSSASAVTDSINTALGLSKEKTHEFLSSITYIATVKIKSFDPKFSKSIPADHISSFRETTMEKHYKKHLREWIEHNKTHLSRVYPNGVRIDSSNYDPILAWYTGSQMIALNTQTHDVPNILNDGMFRQNGGCGYVLKPDYMLFRDGRKDPPCRIRINIISGQSLPKMKGTTGFPNPQVEISLSGLPDDCSKYVTGTVPNNGFDPVWDEVFDFSVKVPDLAQLTFQVMNDDPVFGVNKQTLIASGSIPLRCLRSGFRIVRLYDENGRNDFEFAFATLFVHVSKQALGKEL